MLEWTVIDNTKTKPIYTMCPACKNNVTFLPIDESIKDLYFNYGHCTSYTDEAIFTGLRKCSHPDCGEIIAFRFNEGADPIGYDYDGDVEYSSDIFNFQTLPAVDSCIQIKNLPKNVRNSFIEAQKCFYNECFMASAVMIRKTLEEICADKGFDNGIIKTKVDNLIQSGKLPSDISTELHELRNLGNDGAHIELKHFNDLGDDEIKSALDLLTLALEKIYCPKPDEYKEAVNNLKIRKKTS